MVLQIPHVTLYETGPSDPTVNKQAAFVHGYKPHILHKQSQCKGKRKRYIWKGADWFSSILAFWERFQDLW